MPVFMPQVFKMAVLPEVFRYETCRRGPKSKYFKETGVNQYSYNNYILAGVVLLIGACASNVRNFELPAWAVPVGLTTISTPVQLQGQWILNTALSDDPQQLLRRAVGELQKNRRTVVEGVVRRGPGGGLIKIDEPGIPQPDPYRDAAVSNPRLAAAYARSILIGQNENAISFSFDAAAPVDYLISQATSSDQNINLTFADWEGSQFVVEKNGPDGLVLERWILSPDRSQLYVIVGVEIKLPDFPLPSEPVLIGRMFDRKPG
jgi:hypothetical protein